MDRLSASSRLMCLLVAFAMVVPVSAFASAVPCCCDDPREADAIAASEATADCCGPSSCDPVEEPAPLEDGQESDCDECDCPSMCCSPVKAPVGVTGERVSTVVPPVRVSGGPERMNGPGLGAVFEIAHPPNS